jgi:hypothetical protein
MASLHGQQKLYPLYWVVLTLLVLALDYASGPLIQFPVFYLIPVTLAAWYSGRQWGFLLALIMPFFRICFVLIWDEPWTWVETSVNTVIRIIVLCFLVYLVDLASRQSRSLKKEVRVLKGILPVCGFCKKIRDQENHWQSMETYISQNSEAFFSHGFCPECMEEHYGDELRKLSHEAERSAPER